ncbi:uncharacterized protein MELLADRAFT_77257 [Melampsora larici-populina 98AG31]|uniref:Uncharacterized protein n=1 Tax=Melampsora larici-populina (strain 98AG31 / pathotype 3-4-7) TaxID=747676 RepID=F4RFE9_MELLP|nr:uncharacterized protein MELLADRAFT_77257 [Melampsora larici-populina 98AG31]EGG08943.1 hypothetical protein MELLADRAFT_77257 [Melampsora larici-populina 98AG31]
MPARGGGRATGSRGTVPRGGEQVSRGRGRGATRGATPGDTATAGGRPAGQHVAPRRPNSGLAISKEGQATKLSLKRRLGIEIPHRLGPCNDVCTGCGALHWKEERPESAVKSQPYAYKECCQKGQVTLPADYAGREVTPLFLEALLTGDTREDKEFRRDIRRYNNAFSFTSLGAEVDHTVNGPFGVNTFRISGALHHNISGLLPEDGQRAAYSQVYVTGDGATGEITERATRRFEPVSGEEGAPRVVRPVNPLNRNVQICWEYHHYRA